jgi:hypothetical protein
LNKSTTIFICNKLVLLKFMEVRENYSLRKIFMEI